MDYSLFCELRHRLTHCRRIKDLEAICELFCSKIGMELYMFGVCEAVSFTSPKIVILSNYPQPCLNEYRDNDLVKTDPIVKYCFSHTAPILWDELKENRQFSDEERFVLKHIKRLGIETGFSVPLNALTGQMGFLSLASLSRVDHDDLYQISFSTHTFANYLFDAYLRVDLKEHPKVKQLTERELECVYWACDGKTAWEMARILQISERTVNFHLTSVIKKLGASNRQHAVAKAVLYGLIKPWLFENSSDAET